MKKVLASLLLLIPYVAGAQVNLTLNNAIDSALQNNFDIQIAKNSAEINKINNTYGAAGGLPSFNANAGDNNSLYNLKQKTSSGLDISKSNVNNNSYNASLTGTMVLFNGFRIIATKERLNLLQKQGDLQLNLQIESTLAAVMETYYDIIRQQSYLNIILSNIDVSSKKLDIIQERFKVGMANEADILQARIDLNMNEQNLKSQQVTIEQAKTSLLELMGVKKYFSIVVNEDISVDPGISKDTIFNYLESNPQYLSAAQQIKINEQIVKEVRAQRYPSLKISTGYNFTYNSSSAGFNLFTQNYGPAVGASLVIPIFNGNIYRTQQEAAIYNVRNAVLQKESLLSSLKAETQKTFESYESALQQLTSQRVSFEDSRKLVDLIVQRFRLNQATILDVKAAQDSFENAGYLFVNLQYSAKVAEIELKRLIYRLGF